MLLLRTGAEANIYFTNFMNRNVVVKRRVRKAYRIREVDRKVREYRTIHEAQLLNEAKAAGVATPSLYLVNRSKMEIIMELVEGIRLKDGIEQSDSRSISLCAEFGRMIARLHAYGIIHGDLTTSNVIITESGKLVLLDFGLSFHSNNIENQAVDLHLLKQVFLSFHIQQAKRSLDALLEGYSVVAGEEKTAQILRRIREIEARGRYIPPEARVISEEEQISGNFVH